MQSAGGDSAGSWLASRIPASRLAWILALLLTPVLAVSFSAPAAAHDVGTQEGHAEEDAVVHSPADERRLERRTEAITKSDARAADDSDGGDPGEVGRWGPVVDWPVVAINAALLPNGDVLAYDSVGDMAPVNYEEHDFTRATVWDPGTGEQTANNVTTGFNLFCSGLAHLIDGSIFTAGGNKNSFMQGIQQTNIFDGVTGTWTRGPDMEEARWYPSVTPLANEETLISDGTEGYADVPEVRQTDGSLRQLPDAALDLPLYPWMDVAPDGNVFYSGPDQTIRSLDPSGTGSWQTLGVRDEENRDYGGHAMFDVGKMLVAGGGGSSDTARVIDLNGPVPVVTPTETMETGRRQFNLTVLADGSVLATGGNSSGAGLVDLDHGVYTAELWSPETGQWRTLSAEQVTRQYHSSALLLPDGRLLSAGGGVCQRCDEVGYLAKNAEVFSPPYLFKHDGSGELATRPEIRFAPKGVGYEDPFSITTSQPGSISKLALVRLGAVTHSNNMEQRYVPLSFELDDGQFAVSAPSGPAEAPPGYYMLFAINSDGVPSTAKMVQVTDDPPVPPSAPVIEATEPGSPGNDNLPGVSGSGVAGDSTVDIYRGTSCFGSLRGSGSGAEFSEPGGIEVALQRNHTSTLRATVTDSSGNTSRCSSPFTYVEDSTPPATMIVSGPPELSSKRRVKVKLASSEPGSSFECQLDEKPYRPCQSVQRYKVARSKHVIRARAIDQAGNRDGTPSRVRFEVTK